MKNILDMSIYEKYYVLIIILFSAGLLRCFIIALQNKLKDRKIVKFNYRKNKRTKENKSAERRYKRTIQPNKNIDPEMFSNEPLDIEKAGNLKYKSHIEAQWKELNK